MRQGGGRSLLQSSNGPSLGNSGAENRALTPHADLDEKIRLRDPYVAPLNVLQVLALQSLRSFHEGGALPDYARDYNPSNPEVIDLLSRDPNQKKDEKHPFQAAMDDCLLISIKGISAGMQNTG
ncbi:Phosphoenolpyruvate carboxylase 1 [Monoraphidium neglectum]|uniref:Phosphoenolpyruvate carboxylase 1 n=1 Tax=Monoraphidium neglectum TaxID=145388 RepID=A0A0D2IZ49_9CHLO|nr:Phosphoenolpyruvate carboxylase 1 [Monoraphidium neglectum]KIY93127.1 Phosphoenolpyruvate carboxylase 1 [Monoraphidium neglectum]|eukprot:XP_013892147.1 Phosphoenolpyruvate carboxylase 1 [Monoraphidium neglectum]